MCVSPAVVFAQDEPEKKICLTVEGEIKFGAVTVQVPDPGTYCGVEGTL
jgi:hypothetical protein